MTEKQKNLITRSVTGILFVAIMVTGILFRPMAMILLFALITGMTIWEYSGLVNQLEEVTINRFISTVAGVYLFLAVAGFCAGMLPASAFAPYLLTVMYLMISELFLPHKHAVNDWAYTMLPQLYIALPLSMINVLAFAGTPDGMVHYQAILPMSVFIFLWINDSGAYCAGSLLGKRKLFPSVSPGKTWEGSIGGALFVVVAAVLVYFLWAKPMGGELTMPLGLAEWIGLGLVVVVFGTLGDLVESLFKRTLGIKDSGNLLPGHGGMLDRFDSSLMAIPAAVCYLFALQQFG